VEFSPIGPPIQGEWTPNIDGSFVIGSPPLGLDVRCTAQHGVFAIGAFNKIAKIVASHQVVIWRIWIYPTHTGEFFILALSN